MIYDVGQLIRYAECGMLEDFIKNNGTDVNRIVNQIVAHYEEELENICCVLDDSEDEENNEDE